MKYAFAAVALAALARAQGLADIPECAQPCLEKAITDNTDCEVSDLACVCKGFDALQGDATSCVLKECGSETAINEVLPAAEKLCENPPTEDDGDEAEETTAADDKPEPTPAPMPTITDDSDIHYPTPEEPEETGDVVEPPAENEPTPVPTAAAAVAGSMGGLAMVVLGALAL